MNLLSNTCMQELASETVNTSIQELEAKTRAKELTQGDSDQMEDWHLYQDILDYCDKVLSRDPCYHEIFWDLTTPQRDYHGSMLRECMYTEIDKFFKQNRLNH